MACRVVAKRSKLGDAIGVARLRLWLRRGLRDILYISTFESSRVWAEIICISNLPLTGSATGEWYYSGKVKPFQEKNHIGV